VKVGLLVLLDASEVVFELALGHGLVNLSYLSKCSFLLLEVALFKLAVAFLKSVKEGPFVSNVLVLPVPFSELLLSPFPLLVQLLQPLLDYPALPFLLLLQLLLFLPRPFLVRPDSSILPLHPLHFLLLLPHPPQKAKPFLIRKCQTASQLFFTAFAHAPEFLFKLLFLGEILNHGFDTIWSTSLL
jgi:hypothetical protein